MTVDLQQCKPDDKLLTKHGTILTYVGSNDSPYPTKYPHLIKYPNGAFGTRTDNGQVFVQVRRPEDEDIVKILTERKQHA
jgi:hypothetical protein